MKLNLNQFVNPQQLRVMRELCKGEEGQHFTEIIQSLKNTIANMPATYDTDGQGDNAIISLHYFSAGSDWWIIERDMEPEQYQAYGFVCLNGWTDCAESGYINIAKLLENGAELDLYWQPITLGELKKSLMKQAA